MPAVNFNVMVRTGVVRNVGRTFIDFEFIDKIDNQTYRTTLPHPHAGRGGGVLVGIEQDSLILVSKGPGEKWYCLGTIPDHNFFFDLDGSTDLRFDETPYPACKPGEVAIKGNAGNSMFVLANGNIRMDSGAGSSFGDFELSRNCQALFTRVDQRYSFSEAGRCTEGLIRRDLNTTESSNDTATRNFLDAESYDDLLKVVGRFPSNIVDNRTTTLIRRTLRNPALVEKRGVVYEYADSFNVKDFEREVDSHDETSDNIGVLQRNVSARENRRTDVLNLNLRNYNHLIEKVEGTLVDIYGNVLDINRNIIAMPDVTDIKSDGNDSAGLRRAYDHHRRSIKFHYEINTRKPISTSEPTENDKSRDNAKNFSRWSVDVDAEGLTKINIPASSETGNIPVLSRYFTSRDSENPDSGAFKDPDRKDIRIQQFGAKSGNNFVGTTIKNSNYRPETVDGSSVTVGTAYHDILRVAKSLIDSGSVTDSNKLAGATRAGPVSSTVTNKIPDLNGTSEANAGGRSMNLNLDGSMEMSIGADTVDRKSLVIDTQGSVISHYGADRNGRSIIHQSDGTVIIQIGGGGTDVSDSRFGDDSSRPGRLEIHLNKPGLLGGSGTPQKIIIDEGGMTLDVQGNMYFKSSGDMILDSGARLLLNGELVFIYGEGDVDTRQVISSETIIVRAGSPQFT